MQERIGKLLGRGLRKRGDGKEEKGKDFVEN